MPLKIKLAFQALSIVKKNWPQLLVLLLLLLMIPIFLITSVVASLFAWVGWDKDEPQQTDRYKKVASVYGLRWQDLLAIDLAKNEMDQDKLNPQALINDFVYYVDVDIPVYKTKKEKICNTNGCGEVKVPTAEIDYYRTEKQRRTRSFAEVIAYLNFELEQQEIARNNLSLLMGGEGRGGYGSAQVAETVLVYEPLVRRYAAENGIEDYVYVILALIMQESGGRYLDVMQASESLGLPPNTITDPEYSIQIGVSYFAGRLRNAGFDLKLALQAYNFGNAFIPYALDRGGYSKENTIAFSEMMARRMGWVRYGDVNYVDNVLRYINAEKAYDYPKVLAIMQQYVGMPYLIGGRTPEQGAFDGPGLIEYTFAQIGKDLYGTVVSQYDKTTAVSENEAQPGDLIFFETYKRGPSHVGMYVGDGKFLNANENGVEYSSVESWKKKYSFLGFRRIP